MDLRDTIRCTICDKPVPSCLITWGARHEAICPDCLLAKMVEARTEPRRVIKEGGNR